MKSILKLTILDKFILKQIAEVFILGVVVFTSIIFASDTFISLIKQISNYGMPLNIAFMIILLNLPAVIVMTIPMSVLFSNIINISDLGLKYEAIYSTIIGSNLGAFLTPVGALAGIMFTDLVKKQDIDFSFLTFIKYGIIISIPTLIVALMALSFVL